MGERTSFPRDALTTPRAIEQEVNLLRQRTETLLSELERRLGRRLSAARGQVRRLQPAVELLVFVRRHKGAALLLSASTLLLLGRIAARITRRLTRDRRRLVGRVPSPPRSVRISGSLFRRALEGAVVTMVLSLLADRRA
jgi:hypothetical protein